MEVKNLQRKRKTWSNFVASREAKHGFLFLREGQALASPIKEHDIRLPGQFYF